MNSDETMDSDEDFATARRLHGRCSFFQAFPAEAAKDKAIRELRRAETDARVQKWLGPAVETTHPVGVDFFDNFVNTKTAAPVSRTELQQVDAHFSSDDYWVSQRYATSRRTYDSAITLTDIRSILECLDPYILEDILLLGVAVDVRCILASAVRNMLPMKTARPSNAVLHAVKAARCPHIWSHHLQLCNSRIHDKDTEKAGTAHALRKKVSHAYSHVNMRSILHRLMYEYVNGKEASELHGAIAAEYSRINIKDPDAHLNITSVVNIFDAITRYTNAQFTEHVFILGCAAVLRNLITCLEGIIARNTHGDEYEEIKWYFRYCNTKNFELGLTTGNKFDEELSVYYYMLSDVMHGLDPRSQNNFFYGELFDLRFNTIRWEVLSLLFIFLVKLPDHTPIRSRLFIRSLVRAEAMV